MNKHSIAALLLASGAFLASHVPVTHAAVSLGGKCDNNTTEQCAPGLVCSNRTCQHKGDQIGDDLQRCKDKLTANGMGSGGRPAMNKNFCYDDASCPDIYKQLKELGKEVDEGASGNISYAEWQKQVEARSAAMEEAHSQRDSTIIKAASQACSQCTSGGKPRCFYPARDILY